MGSAIWPCLPRRLSSLTRSDISSSRLFVAVDAPKINPFILNFSATKKTVEPRFLHSSKASDDYGDGNCCVAFSPLVAAGLTVERKGLVKVMNCAAGNRPWNVNPLEREILHAEGVAWGNCKVGFSENGRLGLAVDRMGKILAVRFLDR